MRQNHRAEAQHKQGRRWTQLQPVRILCIGMRLVGPWLAAACAALACVAVSAASLPSQEVLVLLEDSSLRSSHSLFFSDLRKQVWFVFAANVHRCHTACQCRAWATDTLSL